MMKKEQKVIEILKKCCLFVLVFGLLINCTNVVYADEVTYTTGEYGHSPNSYNHTLYDSFIYSDSFFEQSAYNADLHLAIVSLVLAETSISAKDVDYSEKSQNLTQFLTNVGFQDIAVNDDYKIKPTEDTFAVAVAYKQLGDTVLLAIVPRSAGYEVEWGDNFNIGSSGLHAGYENARNKCLEFAKEYISSRREVFNNKTVKVWVSGYSRGAGVANVIGAALDDDSTGYIGLNVSRDNIFTYTFGSPLTATTDLNPEDEKYNNIHNYYSDYDMSTMMPLSTWGFKRYGENIELKVHDATIKEKMLPLLEKMNSYVYEAYTTTQDPDDFSPMTLSINSENQYSIVKDTDSKTTTPKTLKDFLDDRVTILSNTVFSSREKYVANYQEAMMEIAKLLKGESSENVAKFMNAAKSNESFQPLLVMLFFYDMVQDYTSDKLNDPVPENWQEQIKALVPAPNSTSLNPIVNEVVKTAVYSELYNKITSTDTVRQYGIEVNTYADLMEVYRLMSAEYMDSVLKAGLSAIGYSVDDHPLTKKENEKALSEIAANLLFGTTVTTEYDTSKVVYKAKIALTLLGNTFNRVHNHEILISWMRAMDNNPIEVSETYTIDGDSTWKKGSSNVLQLSYDKGTVTKVKIDGYEIDTSKYTIDSENRTVQLSSSLLEELNVRKHMISFVFDNMEAYHEFEIIEDTPTPVPTSETKKSSGGWDDGGPFTTDNCGNVYDRWGNIIYEAIGCNLGGYNLVQTSVND